MSTPSSDDSPAAPRPNETSPTNDPNLIHGREKFVGSQEIMDFLGCKRTTLWRWIKYEGLPSYQIGRKGDFRFRLSEVEAWLVNRNAKPND